MNFGIIGTSGRREDKFKLNKHLYKKMTLTAYGLLQKLSPDSLISGGAAWADFVAVKLFVNCYCPKITLHIPCNWDYTKKQFLDLGNFDFKTNPGGTANYYHRHFQQVTGENSLLEIQKAIDYGANIIITNGFMARNTKVANESDVLLAMTFGNKEFVKDGGTSDTVKKFLNKSGVNTGYHFDLTTTTLYNELKIK